MRPTISILTAFVLLLAACAAPPAAQAVTPTPAGASLPSSTPTDMPHTPDPNFPTTRDIYRWPFAPDSIWNMPIGADAIYLPAKIAPAGSMGMTVDEDVIILTPDAPLLDVYVNHEGWSGRNRCAKQEELVGRFPVPAGYYLPHTDGTPNNSTAILMPDGRTVAHNQPFHRCPDQQYGTTGFTFPNVDLYGDGIRGSHGATGLSALGGTLRLDELVPGGVIRHALKVNLYAHINVAYDPQDATPGYRWPAGSADNYAADPHSNLRYGGKNPALEMGALLALHPSVDLTSLEHNSLGLETEPALIVARAFQDYGAYLVDDTAWDVYALAVEQGPDGKVVDEFEKIWKFSMTPPSTQTPWARDMQRIFTNLYIVDNNGPQSIGGGGEPRQPMAPTVKAP